jgi:diguanylate cyclase (GGDEF)-like protein
MYNALAKTRTSIADESKILERIRGFNSSLDRLMVLYTNGSVDSTEFARIVTKEAGDQLGVARVSSWSLRDDRLGIDCADLYLAATNEHQSGAKLEAKDFPLYFDAVLAERVIAANDASIDPRTSEFTDVYLRPNRINSMLDAQIRSAAGPRGVVCIETVDTYRDWSPDEIAYAVSVAELIGIFMDREERRAVHSKLEVMNERFALAMTAAVDGIWDLDLVTDFVYYSTQNFTLLGEAYDAAPTDFGWWQQRVHPDDVERTLIAFDDHIRRNLPFNETYRIRHQDETWRWWRSRGQVTRDKSGRAVRVVGTNSDVTDLVEMQTELERRNQQLILANRRVEDSALHDALTELPNRRYLDRVCHDFLEDTFEERPHLSVLHIDLDYFKDVNDKFGHAVGDATLVRVAKYLDTLRNQNEFVARIGGDEFIAILDDTPDAARALVFSAELNNLLDLPMTVDGHAFTVSASIGIAGCSSKRIDIWKVLGDADLALYEAKRSGKRTHQVFDPNLREWAEYSRRMKDELCQALAEGDQIVPFFQAQFDAKTLEIAGFEVLARWEHPERGLLGPDKFLAFAQELGCVAELDRQILKSAMTCVRQWRSEGFIAPRLSVNISSERLVDPQLIACVEALGDDVNFLSFELLETTFLDYTNDQVAQALDSLRRLGVDFEIDDFGTGYASILGLVNVRPTRLKVDRSLTRNVNTDVAMTSLVQSIVDIASALKIEVIAEGVESESQLRSLCEIGCDVVQGFHLAMPVSSDEIMQRYVTKALKRTIL